MSSVTAQQHASLRTPREAHFWDPGHPVYRHEDGVWQVFSYPSVRRLLVDDTAFSADPAAVGQEVHPLQAGCWVTEGRQHRDLREAIAGRMHATSVAGLRTAVDAALVPLLDAAEKRGRFEVMGELVIPFSAGVVSRLLGVDPSYAWRMYSWRGSANSTLAEQQNVLPVDQQVGTPTAEDQLADVLTDLISRYRASSSNPPGVLDELVARQRDGYLVDGRAMSDAEVVGALTMLLWSTVGTTTAQLADALLFLTSSGWWKRLGQHPDVVPTAVEEVVRWYPVYSATWRFAVQDVVLDGVHIPAGDQIAGWLTAANRDAAHFTDPHTFNPLRRPNPHLGYGAGRHHCLGRHLARQMITTLIDQASSRWPDLQVDEEVPFRRILGVEDAIDEAHFRLR